MLKSIPVIKLTTLFAISLFTLSPTNAAVNAISPGAVLPSESVAVPQAAPELVSIPPMIVRPVGKDDGPKIQVKAFKINNALARADLGLTLEGAQDIANQAIRAGDGQFTMGQLQVVADSITNYYRRAGLILARVVVPSQDVKNGVVSLSVLPGVLGSVAAEGNQGYSVEQLSEPFTELLNNDVDKESVEGALLYLSDYPGAELFGVFRPGKNEGETEILLKMQKERSYTLDAQINNHGSEYTGDYQARINASWLNPTGNADQLNLNLLHAFDPDNNLFGSVSYQIPFLSHKNAWGIRYARNGFDVGEALAAQNISGESEIYETYLSRSFERRRQINVDGRIGFSRKRSNTTQAERLMAEDRLSVLDAQLKIDGTNRLHAGGITQGLLRVSRGLPDFIGSMNASGEQTTSRLGGSGERAGGDFTKLNLSLVHLQRLNKNHSLLLRFEGQHSSDMLVSLEQVAVGGPTNVRAYGPSEYLRDSAIFGSVEWTIKAPGFADVPAFGSKTWGDVLQVALFYDAAKGWLNDPLGSEFRELDLYGAGLGLRLYLTERLSANFDLAFPGAVLDPENGRDPQYYFSVKYRY